MTHTGYTLTWKSTSSPPLPYGGVLRPDTLGSLDRLTLARTTLRLGRSEPALGDLFDIEGQPGDTLTLRNLPPLSLLGQHMTRGSLIIEGDAGDDLGAAMAGGFIHVRGSAGHRVGGPAFDSTRGMTGGEIRVDGAAGDDVGLLMRRGLIAVAGPAGKSPGYRMSAGTVALLTGPLDHPGLEMRRGTILCADPDADITTGRAFTETGVFSASALPTLALLERRLRTIGCALPQSPARLRLWTGDRFELHRGEVCQWLY